jgi:hypothetical protein
MVNHLSVQLTGHLAWEMRTRIILPCEGFLRTVPQASPDGTVQSGQRCERHNRKTATGVQPQTSAQGSGGSYETSIHWN